MSLRLRSAALVAVALMVMTPTAALAHEDREVAGYQIEVGWMSEPAIEGQKNGVDLRITQADKPVEDVEKTLQVEITHRASGAKKTFALRTIFRDPGHYTVDVIPTAPGQYEMRLWQGFGWILVIGGAFAAAAADRGWTWQGRPRSPWYGASAAAAGVVVLVLVAPRFAEPTSLPPTSPATLALGEQVYQANCQRCHGAGFVPAEGVADLRAHALMHADTGLMEVVRDGRTGTAMPAFRGTLSEKEIGAVLTYIQEEVRRLEAKSTPSPPPAPAR